MSPKKLFYILIFLFLGALGFSFSEISLAQTDPEFDVIWWCQDCAQTGLDFAGRPELVVGSQVSACAQPAAKINLAEYDFAWFVNRQKQPAFSGAGKNLLSFTTAAESPAVYEVSLQIKKGGAVIKTQTLNLLTKKPELLLYRGLSDAKTEFYFKKAVSGTATIASAKEYFFKAFLFPLLAGQTPSFAWQVNEAKSEVSQENEFLLKVPETEQKQGGFLSAMANLSALGDFSRKINLSFQ